MKWIECIKLKLGNYGIALEKHRARHNHKVEKWREALVEVGNIFGEQVEGLQSTFIQNTVKLFRERLAVRFPECHHPVPKGQVLQGMSASPSLRHESSADKILFYTTTRANNGGGVYKSLRKILESGNVVYEVRNCSDEPMYVSELKELLGKKKVRLPTVIVNGKDLCGEEEIPDLLLERGLSKLLKLLLKGSQVNSCSDQLGNYSIALEKHRARHNHKVDKWREALVEVGNIFGEHVEGLQSTFIQNTVKLFRERLAARFPECRQPVPKGQVLQGTSSSPSLSHESSAAKIILYTTTRANNGESVRKILESANVVYEVRNCSDEPMYVSELKELLGKKKVRFPTVIVNGKDLCGEEEEEGFHNIEIRQKLKKRLMSLYRKQYLAKARRRMKKRRKKNIFKIQCQWIVNVLVCTFKTQCKCNVSGDRSHRTEAQEHC
ncbi:hypothetical protein ACET3Z_006140 [Daucus carota]